MNNVSINRTSPLAHRSLIRTKNSIIKELVYETQKLKSLSCSRDKTQLTLQQHEQKNQNSREIEKLKTEAFL